MSHASISLYVENETNEFESTEPIHEPLQELQPEIPTELPAYGPIPFPKVNYEERRRRMAQLRKDSPYLYPEDPRSQIRLK